MITKNQEVVEELKKKQLEASLETSLKEKSCQTDTSYQEIKEKKSLPSKEKKKAAKKAMAPKQKNSGILAWFSGKWKGIFTSDSKENKKIRNISERKVREQLSIGEQGDLFDTVRSIKSMLTDRLKEGDHYADFDYIYEDEKPLIEDFEKANLSEKEKEAVHEYAYGSFQNMNDYLRGIKTDVPKEYREGGCPPSFAVG